MAVQSDGGGVDASIPSLIVHAGRVQGVADRVGTAAQAGGSVPLGQGAYGRLCGFLPYVVNKLQGMVVDGLGTAESSLRDTAARLRTAAQAYDEADGRAQQRLGPS
jgi:hypothetical protein